MTWEKMSVHIPSALAQRVTDFKRLSSNKCKKDDVTVHIETFSQHYKVQIAKKLAGLGTTTKYRN